MSYKGQARVREMTKQEEILLKKKQEIERKQKGNVEQSEISDSESEDDDSSSGIMNKFANDGSFFEQFRKISTNKTEKKPELKCRDARPALKHIKEQKKQMVKNVDQVRAPEIKFEMISGELQKNVENTGESKAAEPHPDWFKEALSKAREKAQQFTTVNPASGSTSPSESPLQKEKKRSRWASEDVPSAPVAHVTSSSIPVMGQVGFNLPISVLGMIGEGQHNDAIRGVMVSNLTRNNPAIINYAKQVFGNLDLTDSQWKQCEEQMKMNVVFQLLQLKKAEAEKLQQMGKVKYEYDSDEETDGGTWEHKMRKKEMEKTHQSALMLTDMAEGKHHIGDFLPPDELTKFMEKYRAMKEGRDPDTLVYQDNKLTEDNVGYKMLKSMGWTEGMGLGAEGKGIIAPVVQKPVPEKQGLGVEQPDEISENDDEYDAYRKRMMLAYRFRPNPLNNPRRAYY